MQSHDSTSQKVLLPAFNLLKMYLNEISLESSDIIFCRKQVEGGFWYTSRRPVYRLTQDFIQRLNRTVINNTDLQVFCFNDFDDLSVEVEWTPEQTCAVGHALKNHPTLEKIDIEISREAKPNVIVNFLQCLTGSAPIKTLHLKLHENVDESFLNEIGKIFLKNTSLKEIRIALSDIHQDIFKNSLAEFFEGLVHIPSLKELCLKNFSAADDNLKILHKMHSLKKLTLDSMNCTDESMVILSDILKVNLNIEFLDLSANPLDALGIKILADTLPFLPFLKYLRLDNIILPMQNSEGFDYLAAIFKQHGLKVEYLHIEQRVDNRFYSAQGLQDLISDNRYLKKLYVGDLL
ncbi:MAG TPA: hypothetical protein VHM20_05975, partial [Gammaproteobacteria bacterium]|nr:hypothetical protein [Gammaproteobacteria bacterium]